MTSYTQSDIDRDLRPLSPAECAERGIRPSSEDDHTAAILTGDSFAARRRMFCHSVNKAFRKADQ